MGNPKRKRDKPRNRGKEEAPGEDRSAALPAITAPSFESTGRPADQPEVTSPATAPGVEERAKAVAELDPSAYAGALDSDPELMTAEFHAASGKQLDAGGRLIGPDGSRSLPAHLPPAAYSAHERSAPVPYSSPPPPRHPPAVRPPAAGPAPPAASDQSSTDVNVPQFTPVRTPRAAVPAQPRPASPPAPREPPVLQVTGERREPGRWVLDKEGKTGSEASGSAASPDERESVSFDVTDLSAGPPGTGRRTVRVLIGSLVVLVASALGIVWTLQALPGGPESILPAPEAQPVPPSPAPEPSRIKITSRPSHATVRINGVSLGNTPLDIESPFAPEADLEVEVLLKGHRSWSKRFPPGESIAVDAQLKPGR